MSSDSSETSILADDVVFYHGAGAARHGWFAVGFGLVLTGATFVLLPFADLISEPPRPVYSVRTVETASPPLPAPELPRFEPRRPAPAVEEVERVTVKPRLSAPPSPDLPRPRLAAGLNLGIDRDVPGDFAVDFTLSPQPPPAAPPLTAPAAPAAARGPAVFQLEQLDRRPQPLVRVPPVYPHRARVGNLEGFVEVRFTVTRDGGVEDIEVVEAVPGNVFAGAATRAVTRWRFEPGLTGGEPVPVRMQVRLRFELR